jgi:uncharacterized protein YjbI with pentapeptide repeats
MANAEHLAILQQGTAIWNDWRIRNPGPFPDLSRASLSRADFRQANLRRTSASRISAERTSEAGAVFSAKILCHGGSMGEAANIEFSPPVAVRTEPHLTRIDYAQH